MRCSLRLVDQALACSCALCAVAYQSGLNLAARLLCGCVCGRPSFILLAGQGHGVRGREGLGQGEAVEEHNHSTHIHSALILQMHCNFRMGHGVP